MSPHGFQRCNFNIQYILSLAIEQLYPDVLLSNSVEYCPYCMCDCICYSVECKHGVTIMVSCHARLLIRGLFVVSEVYAQKDASGPLVLPALNV